jgi:hypothetical protein
MVNHFLRNSVTVTLQWPQEAGAVYHVNVSPEISHIERTSMRHDIFTINFTIFYNAQHNISIVSSLCGVTTTSVLNYGTFAFMGIDYIYDNNLIIVNQT